MWTISGAISIRRSGPPHRDTLQRNAQFFANLDQSHFGSGRDIDDVRFFDDRLRIDIENGQISSGAEMQHEIRHAHRKRGPGKNNEFGLRFDSIAYVAPAVTSMSNVRLVKPQTVKT